MINENNLIQTLKHLNFQIERSNYVRYFSKVNCSVEVDIANRKISYPHEIKINNHTTTNFDSDENFVVLECVVRLLDKGYQPKDIELEKEWKLGHELKGGRSDICVSDVDGKILFIIECKTFGSEYDKERQNMLDDGGQLFSYWNQERSCQWLMLYSSDFVDNEIDYVAECIDCRSDKFKNAHNVKELFDVWSKSYDKHFFTDPIFNDKTVAYKIGVQPLTKKSLKEFNLENALVNIFEEILRHNSISDKETAFNRLMALFICKLADESQKFDDDELDFQFRYGTDTDESFQDRLQRLYHDGMKNFMNEDIYYVPMNFISETVKTYTGQDRRHLIEAINKEIRYMKFYSNNDFAFIEIHNEKLFRQNAKVLREVVEQIQGYKIIGATNLQFLGDLFEQLLNKGFKQNEGQFFTPIPIARFILDSIPLDKLIQSPDELPKIIDYACGAGHFLTQSFEAINDYVKRKFDVELNSNWVKENLFGVEKDYRLARVSKISLFMYGAGSGNIIFGDGLENYPYRHISNESFNLLVANPPYSVSAFKNHLNLSNADDFEVLPKISSTGSEIETLFVERIVHLLKPNGIAAVILPSSILNKESSSFITARELIIKNFFIHAIVQFGGGTFGATNTNTIVMFLEKFENPPPRKMEVEDSLDSIFELRNLVDWEDEFIFIDYLKKINVDESIYKKFLSRENNFSDWSDDEYFNQYYISFITSTEYIKKSAQPSFKKLSQAEQLDWCNRKFYEFAFNIEREKMRYFAYVYQQTTLIVTAPNDIKAQEKFLGYTWSERKRREGIQISKRGGLLYNNSNRDDKSTIASLIRSSFTENLLEVDELKDFYKYLRLQDMIDFSGLSFNKVIRLSGTTAFEIGKNYFEKELLKPLSSVCAMNVSKSEVSKIDNDVLVSFVEMASVSNKGYIENKIDKSIGELRKGSYTYFVDDDILIAKITPCMENGKCAIARNLTNKIGFGSSEFHTFRCDKNKILPEFLFVILNQDYVRQSAQASMTGASGHRRVPASFYEKMIIPLPPLDIQKQIVNEFEVIDEKISVQEKLLEDFELQIKSKFEELFDYESFETIKLDEVASIIRGVTYDKSFEVNVKTNNSILTADNISLEGNFEIKKIIYVSDKLQLDEQKKLKANDIFICLSSGSIKHIGKVAFISEDTNYFAGGFMGIIRANEKVYPQFLFSYLNSGTTKNYFMDNATGSNIKNLSNSIMKIKIPFPPITLQKKFAEYVKSIEIKKSSAIKEKNELLNEREGLINKYFK